MFPVRHRCDSREPTMVPNAPKESNLLKEWSGRWDSNPRLQPWQGCALPLSYARILPPRNGAPIIAPGRPFSRPLLKAYPPVFHLGTGVRAAGRPIPIDSRAASEKTVSLRRHPGHFICFASKAVETPTADKKKTLRLAPDDGKSHLWGSNRTLRQGPEAKAK